MPSGRPTCSTSSGSPSRTASARCSPRSRSGVGAGERIGVVGRNGDGKTTLLDVMTGLEEPDSGRVSRQRGLLIGYLRQHDELVDTHTVREAVLAGRSDHEWAADPRTREVVEVLLAGVDPRPRGGRPLRRRATALLAGRAAAGRARPGRPRRADQPPRRRGGRLAGRPPRPAYVGAGRRHPRPVVPRRGVRVDLGGPRRRRRRLRGRLRVVRPGPGRAAAPGRRHRAAPPQPGPQGAGLAAPRAAGPDVEAEVPHRRRQRAHRGRAGRRGTGSSCSGSPPSGSARTSSTSRTSTWRAAKRSLLSPRHLAARPRRPGRPGRRERRRQDLGAQRCWPASWRRPPAGSGAAGRSRSQHLTQHVDELDPEARVLATVESIRRVTRTADGEITATAMLERFGFTGDRLTARLGDLSGGERRRFQLLRLLLTEPNVLLLDEPTNDLDIETLTVLEDFLDGWPGTLVVVSHDRYFLERTVDTVWALLDDGQISMLPRGVEEYLERRAAALHLAESALLIAVTPTRRRSADAEGGRGVAPRSGRRARRWPASTGSCSGSPPARPSCNAAIARGRPGLRAARRAQRRSSTASPPSGTRWSWSGSRPPRCSSSTSARPNGASSRRSSPASSFCSAAGQLGEQRLLGARSAPRRRRRRRPCPRGSAAR